jgi:hypothetical protein
MNERHRNRRMRLAILSEGVEEVCRRRIFLEVFFIHVNWGNTRTNGELLKSGVLGSYHDSFACTVEQDREMEQASVDPSFETSTRIVLARKASAIEVSN